MNKVKGSFSTSKCFLLALSLMGMCKKYRYFFFGGGTKLLKISRKISQTKQWECLLKDWTEFHKRKKKNPSCGLKKSFTLPDVYSGAIWRFLVFFLKELKKKKTFSKRLHAQTEAQLERNKTVAFKKMEKNGKDKAKKKRWKRKRNRMGWAGKSSTLMKYEWVGGRLNQLCLCRG